MTLIYIPALTILFGILGTISYHLAKAFQKQGIESLKLRSEVKKRGKKSAIYIIGFILNNALAGFQFLALQFGEMSLYSSVFGIGLVALMLYAHYILKEQISKRELLGAVLIIIGTVGIGIFSIFYSLVEPTVIFENFIISLYILTPVSAFIIIIGYKFKNLTLVLFSSIGGIISGVGGSFMYIGNASGGFQPYVVFCAIIFSLGFILGFVSFLLSQIAFARGAATSRYVPIYNALFFLTPFVYELTIFAVDFTDILGFLVKIPFIILVIIGLYFIVGILINTLKEPEEKRILEEVKIEDES
jgi:multidrug transporter EmrE-like cation transporter